MAAQKGWKEISIKGEPMFRQRVCEAAAKRGIGMLDADLKQYAAPALREFNAKAQAQAEAERQAEANEYNRQRMAERQTRAQAQAQAEAARQRWKDLAPSKPHQPAQPPAKPVKETPQEFAQRLTAGHEQKRAAAASQAQVAATQPQPTLKALQAELATLKAKEWTLKDAIKQNQPAAAADDSKLHKQARELAVRQINDEAKASGYTQALPANEWEYDHQNGWGRGVMQSQRELDEHRKTQKPLMFGRSEWEQKDKQLAAEAERWKQTVKARDEKLAQLTTEKLHQVKQEHHRKHAEQPAKLAEAEKRLAANQHRKTEIERTLKEPHYVAELKRGKDLQRSRGKER